jgi:putative SOS response-associated peptidase YedK
MREISDHFNVGLPSFESEPSYNIVPTQEIIIINNLGVKQLVKCHWGFVPSWAKDLSIGSQMINARAETVAEKPSFKSSFRNQRCLVIANGFYEWQKDMKRKVPVYISLKSGKPLGFAGLYNVWVSPKGENICTCSIITTEANELLSNIHDRMPVIIPREQEDIWLDPKIEDVEFLQGILRPFPSEEMMLTRVSDRVNSPGYNSPENIKSL